MKLKDVVTSTTDKVSHRLLSRATNGVSKGAGEDEYGSVAAFHSCLSSTPSPLTSIASKRLLLVKVSKEPIEGTKGDAKGAGELEVY